MMQRKLGIDLVTAIGLGAMPMSLAGRPDEAQAIKVIETFVNLGGNFIDTANVYCIDDADIGHNERLINKALTQIGKRDSVIIATKGGLRRPNGGWVPDGNPAWIRESCEKSLKDLNVETIDLYQLHAVDPNFGLINSLEEIVKLQEEGKIKQIGLSNVSLNQLQAALTHTSIVSVQNRCNPFEKEDFHNQIIDFCAEHDIAYIAHSPMGGHYGYGKLNWNALLARLGQKYNASAYRITLAWLLAKGNHLLPIPGASKVSSIEDSMSAMDLKLDLEDIDAIDQIKA